MANLSNNSLPHENVIKIPSDESTNAVEITARIELQPAAEQSRLTLKTNPNNNSVSRKRARTSRSKKSDLLLKKRYHWEVAFKAIEEHGEDDKEAVHKTSLTSMAMKSFEDMRFPSSEAFRAIERCGLENEKEHLVDAIHAPKTEEDDIQGLNCVRLQRKHSKQKVVEQTRSTTKRIRRKPMIGFGVPNARSTMVQRYIKVEGRGPPYFYFENVARPPLGVWEIISKELYHIEPEFVDSLHFCAATRKRGYVHNLPVDNRLQILREAPSTIQQALPCTKEWWPQWDDRTTLNCIVTRHAGSADVERINKVLGNSGPDPPEEIRKNVIQECRKNNLVWVGKNTVGILQPVQIEAIMGFPEDHTSLACKTTRYKCLGNTFQVETVAYHLSVLLKLFPKGIRVLSLFSGIGGAEVALHRLGIPLNFVVSVENSKDCRLIQKNWWRESDQKGRLIHISNVKKVTRHKLIKWMKSAGGFDLVIGGSPCNNLAGKNLKTRTGLEGEQSSLFFEYSRILKLVRTLHETCNV